MQSQSQPKTVCNAFTSSLDSQTQECDMAHKNKQTSSIHQLLVMIHIINQDATYLNGGQ